MTNLVSIKNLNKIYKSGTHALKDIDLDIQQGEFLILLGLSGSGKSTLLRSLNRLVEPTSGAILFENNDILALKGKHLRSIRSKIAMVYQQFNLIKPVSVLANVLTGALYRTSILGGIFWKKDEKEFAKKQLQRVGLEEQIYKKASQLSGGQQQRVAIARALMQNPKMILADEPVASLDPATSDSVMRYLGKLNKEDNLTIVCSLHFLSLARKYGSRVVALKDGKIVFNGKPEDLNDTTFKSIYGDDAEEVEIR
jgi:phosphonate transport system ATP-binding protein